jgi:hypothetical protein
MCSRRASVHRLPLPSSPAAEPLDPASLCHPPAGSSLVLPGATSPPRDASPPKRTDSNRIYRPAARPAPSDLRPAAQHKKTRPERRRESRTARGEGSLTATFLARALGLCRGASSGGGTAEGEGGSRSRLPCRLSHDAGPFQFDFVALCLNLMEYLLIVATSDFCQSGV